MIDDVPREAAGLFECKTNSDETKMTLRVTPINEFLKPLEDQECYVKEEVTFECQMSDTDEDCRAEWVIAGKVVEEDDRIKIKALDKGVHRLTILHARIADQGTVICKCVGQNETSAKLTVKEADAPKVEAEDQQVLLYMQLSNEHRHEQYSLNVFEECLKYACADSLTNSAMCETYKNSPPQTLSDERSSISVSLENSKITKFGNLFFN